MAFSVRMERGLVGHVYYISTIILHPHFGSNNHQFSSATLHSRGGGLDVVEFCSRLFVSHSCKVDVFHTALAHPCQSITHHLCEIPFLSSFTADGLESDATVSPSQVIAIGPIGTPRSNLSHAHTRFSVVRPSIQVCLNIQHVGKENTKDPIHQTFSAYRSSRALRRILHAGETGAIERAWLPSLGRARRGSKTRGLNPAARESRRRRGMGNGTGVERE